MADNIVALDIGTTEIRAVEAQIKKNTIPKILKVHTLELDYPLLQVDNPVHDKEALTEALTRLWKEAKFKSKRVITMASGEAYENLIVDNIPWMEPNDFKKALHVTIRNDFPFEVEDYYFDSYTLNEYYKLNNTDPSRYSKILALAVRRDFTDTLIEAIEGAGLLPIGIDIMPFTLIRGYYPSVAEEQIPANAIIVSIEIGGDITTIVIHQNGQPIYMNTATPMGGRRITEALARELHLTYSEAEMVKRSFTYTEEERANAVATSTFEDGQTQTTPLSSISELVLRNAADIISREVTLLINHVSDILEDAFATREGKPYEIVLSGGTADLATLSERLQTQLGYPVRKLVPYGLTDKKIKEAVKHPSHFVSVFGLLVGQEDE